MEILVPRKIRLAYSPLEIRSKLWTSKTHPPQVDRVVNKTRRRSIEFVDDTFDGRRVVVGHTLFNARPSTVMLDLQFFDLL